MYGATGVTDRSKPGICAAAEKDAVHGSVVVPVSLSEEDTFTIQLPEVLAEQ
jgi:hypothetical protein